MSKSISNKKETADIQTWDEMADEINENYYITLKKYLKDEVMGKKEYMIRLTRMFRSIKKDDHISMLKIKMDAGKEVSENSAWKKDSKQTADPVYITFGFQLSSTNKEKIAEKVIEIEQLDELKDTEVVEITPLKGG